MTDSDTETAETLYVVASRHSDNPHPQVEAVYDNEDAAKQHTQAISNSNSIQAPIAWDTHEVEVQSEVTDCPVCECEDVTVKSGDSVLGPLARCGKCATTWGVSP